MSYLNNNGKYEKAYHYLFKKLVPSSGVAYNNLGEALRLVTKVYYRKYNDGDSYHDCIEYGIVPDFSKNHYPFDKEYKSLGRELDTLLRSGNYDDALNLVLLHIMLSLSSTSNVYSPEMNRLVSIHSPAGKRALILLDLNSVFVNYCGKNEAWLPETLRKEGVKISKVLSYGTKKELKCDTVTEFYKASTDEKNSVRVTLSEDNAILSKKFSKIQSDHKKSVKEYEKKMREREKRYELINKKQLRKKIKDLNMTKKFFLILKEMTPSKRVDFIKNLLKVDIDWRKNTLVKMLLITLIDYKERKVTTKSQRENRVKVIDEIVKSLNEVGAHVSKTLSKYDDGEHMYSDVTYLDDKLETKLDELLIKILGSSEAVDKLYISCCRY